MDFAAFESGVAFQFGVLSSHTGGNCCLLQHDELIVTITGCENGNVCSTTESTDYPSNLISSGRHGILFLSFYGSVFDFLIRNDERVLVSDTLSAAASCDRSSQMHWYIDDENRPQSISDTSPITHDKNTLYAMPLRTFLSYTTPLVLKAMQMAYAPISDQKPIMACRTVPISFTRDDVSALKDAGGVAVTSESVRLLAELTISSSPS
jgi:hypothetical protein